MTSGWIPRPLASVNDLTSLRGEANGEIDIKWTHPADTGKTEEVSAYIIKYATYPLSEIRWNNASEVSSPPVPGPVGQKSAYIISGLEDDRFYYIGIKSRDDANNISDISNITVSSTNFIPRVNIEYPAGGVTLSGKVTLNWNYSDVNTGDTHDFDIMLSDNGGISYDIIIVTGLPDGTTFYSVWNTLEVGNRPSCRIKITVEDNFGLTSSTASSNFTVNNDNFSPEITVNYPRSEETWTGVREINWDFLDSNELDELSFNIYISSEGGDSWKTEKEDLYKGMGLNSGTTNYIWDTTTYPDGNRYKVKVTGSDSLLTGEDVSSGEFILYNINLPPKDFSLISPATEKEINVLAPSFNWEDSNDPNIPLGDSFKYKLYYSQNSNFKNASAIEGITVSSYTLETNLIDMTEYWWRVSAIDDSGLETFNTGGARSFYVKWAIVESEDGKLTVSANKNLPEESCISIRKTSEDEAAMIRAANNNARGDPILRAINSSGFVVELNYKNTGMVLDVPEFLSDITLEYDDSNNDGYVDGCDVSEDQVRIVRFKESRWELASADQIIDAGGNKVTARDVKGLSLFAVQLYKSPAGHLFEIRSFPNPFKAGEETTEIIYTLNENSNVKLSIYNLAEDPVYEREISAGDENGGKGYSEGFTNHLFWDGKNGRRKNVADGIYILLIRARGSQSGELTEKKRLIGVLK